MREHATEWTANEQLAARAVRRRSIDELVSNYADYCEAKRDIEEEPGTFDFWLEVEALCTP